MKNKSWLMIICCLGPLLLFIAAPALGLDKGNAFWLILVILLVCFMVMGKGGGCCGGHQDKKSETDKKDEEKKPSCH